MKCIFCSKSQQPGQGTIFAYNDGKVIYYCSSKCRRNFKLRRNPKKIKWARQRDKQEKDIAFGKKQDAKTEARKPKV